MIIRSDNLPWQIDERLRNLLQREIAKSGIEERRGVILNFRDPKYDHINGGFHPVEIAVDADGSIKYITDFALYGTPPYVELGKEIDFDFGLKLFQYLSEEYPIQEGQEMYTLWEQVKQPATKQVWFYEMQADGYSLDDKRTKQEGFGDLQDIVAKYHTHNPETDIDRTQKCFAIPRAEIEAEGYDLSLSRYKEDVFEEVHYDPPSVILDRLLQAEVGEVEETDLAIVKSGIVRELLELKEMIG